MIKKSEKKLQLNRETLCVLDAPSMGQVVGGTFRPLPPHSVGCPAPNTLACFTDPGRPGAPKPPGPRPSFGFCTGPIPPGPPPPNPPHATFGFCQK